ncbi:MAG: hypothetical protein ACJASM_003173 [Salibacteraceae bacterium]|jgi:hypothetical protein
MVRSFRLKVEFDLVTRTGTLKNHLIYNRKNRRFQKIVSDFRLKVEFDLESRFPGIAARKL